MRPFNSSDIEIEVVTKTRAAEVLIVGGDEWAVDDAARQLGAAERKVHRCTERLDTPFPCKAMIPGHACPLDAHEIDVVLVVQSRPKAEPSMAEMGAVCALRDRVPVVLAGFTEGSPFAAWADRVPSDGEIVATCDAAVAPSPPIAAMDHLQWLRLCREPL